MVETTARWIEAIGTLLGGVGLFLLGFAGIRLVLRNSPGSIERLRGDMAAVLDGLKNSFEDAVLRFSGKATKPTKPTDRSSGGSRAR